jgi:hypothetical protein
MRFNFADSGPVFRLSGTESATNLSQICRLPMQLPNAIGPMQLPLAFFFVFRSLS